MMLAHGGATGLALEVSILVVPIVVLVAFWRWMRRHEETRDDDEGAAG